MIKRADWLAITKDRLAMLLLFAVAGLALILVVIGILRISPSDIQIPFRFTGYGQSNIDRSQWYTLIGYPLFGLLVAAINGYLAVKLHAVSRMLSLGFIAMTIFILVLALAVANAVFNLAPTV